MSQLDEAVRRPSPDPVGRDLLDRLRAGDEAAFSRLLDQYQGTLLRLAMIYIPDGEIAADLVQETWLAVLQGLAAFEERSSLKTWICRILTNRAKTRSQREGRSVPFSAIWDLEAEDDEPAVAADRFRPAGATWAGGWVSFPRSWDEVPEDRLLSAETREQIQAAIDLLPPGQRAVISLRDVEGWTAEEVCNVLGLSETNQRVLLHRARSKVRRALEQYFG